MPPRLAKRPCDFYPRSPCGERRCYCSRRTASHRYFYPRSPCGERLLFVYIRSVIYSFLSTLSLRRATIRGTKTLAGQGDFYPRSPCGERLNPLETLIILSKFLSTLSLRRATNQREIDQKRSSISIHALLAESDDDNSTMVISNYIFLSTLSLRRATSFINNQDRIR